MSWDFNKVCGRVVKGTGVVIIIGGAVCAAPVWLPAFGIASLGGAIAAGAATFGVGHVFEHDPKRLMKACAEEVEEYTKKLKQG